MRPRLLSCNLVETFQQSTHPAASDHPEVIPERPEADMPDQGPLLQVREVSKSFGAVAARRDRQGALRGRPGARDGRADRGAHRRRGRAVVRGGQLRQYVKDGTVKKFALRNPADIGYLAAYAGASLKSGQITGAQGEKFKAGKLGEYTVGEAGEIVLGPPTEFTANIDQFDF